MMALENLFVICEALLVIACACSSGHPVLEWWFFKRSVNFDTMGRQSLGHLDDRLMD